MDLSEMLGSKRFQMHSVYLIQMFDVSLNMLGPDRELLSEIMLSLGKKHVRYGVTPDMFPAMGEALLYALEAALQKFDYPLSDKVRKSWKEVYGILVEEMIEGMQEDLRKKK